jgi:hypothetical protein
MRTRPQAPTLFNMPGNVSGASGAQATLVLLLLVFMLAFLARSMIGDTIVSVMDDFAGFRAWGAENEITDTESNVPGVSITTPAEDDIYYSDERVGIAGRTVPDEGRETSMVFYRVNDGEWVRASLEDNAWTGTAQKYPQGDYRVEAVAYDDNGGESTPVEVNFTSLFRYIPDARYVIDDIPASMTAGETYLCHITYENSGNLEWNNSGGYTLSPYSNTAFGAGACNMPGPGVLPGAIVSFEITLAAPVTPGSYVVSYRMQGGGYGWFGDEMHKDVNVVAAIYDASVVSVDLPSQMTAGGRYTATIVMKNTGTATWHADGSNAIRLGAVGGAGGDAYRFVGSVSLPMGSGTTVRPGGTYEFRFEIKAPDAGQYMPQFRMMQVGGVSFGETASKNIRVVPVITPTPEPTPVPTTPPYMSYVAYGKFIVIGTDGRQQIGYLFPWCYDGPLVRHNQRSSYLNEPWWPYADWDIGGPNGYYYVYSDFSDGSGSFEMNYGGSRGPFTFYCR